MRIRDKIKKPQRPVVAYEILPPREKDGTLNSYAETISSLLSQTHIDAINIPEVHDEVGRGDRPVVNQKRGEPREFGMLLQDIVGIEAIINRVVVHDPYDRQMKWLEETNTKYEIENMIIVGGESSKVSYPGPTVNEALKAITNYVKEHQLQVPDHKKTFYLKGDLHTLFPNSETMGYTDIMREIKTFFPPAQTSK